MCVRLDKEEGKLAVGGTGRNGDKTSADDLGPSRPLERVTVNLVARASRALQLAVDLTGDSKTDVINRAIQVYAYLEHVTSNGGSIYTREAEGSELQLLKMF